MIPFQTERVCVYSGQVFSGASVTKHIGDSLAASGVVMHPFWGRYLPIPRLALNCTHFPSTEVGPATMFVPKDAPPPKDWDYFKFSNHLEFKMDPHPSLKNVFEPVMIVGAPTSVMTFHIHQTCLPISLLNPAFRMLTTRLSMGYRHTQLGITWKGILRIPKGIECLEEKMTRLPYLRVKMYVSLR